MKTVLDRLISWTRRGSPSPQLIDDALVQQRQQVQSERFKKARMLYKQWEYADQIVQQYREQRTELLDQLVALEDQTQVGFRLENGEYKILRLDGDSRWTRFWEELWDQVRVKPSILKNGPAKESIQDVVYDESLLHQESDDLLHYL